MSTDSKINPRIERILSGTDLKAVSFNGVLIAAWIWLYRAVFPYLQIIFTREEFRTNQIVLAGALLLIYRQLHKGAIHFRFQSRPQLYLPALVLALGSSIGYLLIERYLDINTFSATLFGLASYGLLGLWMRPQWWRAGLPAALLLVGALPFGEHLQTFVGYPVRLLTARIVSSILQTFGVHSLGVDTILVFESGITKVDLPCSGVKSLWTGGLFFLAATWIDRRRINLRWLLVGLGFSLLLMAANLVRVGVLVGVGQVAGWMLLAEMLHVPLGVLGFAGACAVAAAGLHLTGPAYLSGEQPNERSADLTMQRPLWLTPVMAGIVLVMGLLYTPRPQVVQARSLPPWTFPDQLHTEAWQFSPEEAQWLKQSEVETAERWHFSWQGLSGSMLFVTSSTWRAHHRPERCFEVYGLTQDTADTFMVEPDFPVHILSLEVEGSTDKYAAAYWLQSAHQTTDDYATRIWADLAPERQPWVLVTILFDNDRDPRAGDAQALYQTLRDVVHEHLAGGYSQ
jgi:exosortase O